MNASESNACLGSLFPPMLDCVGDAQVKGKVFGYEYRTPDGLGPPKRRVTTDLDAWRECRACADFDECYQLSMARVTMEIAVGQFPR